MSKKKEYMIKLGCQEMNNNKLEQVVIHLEVLVKDLVDFLVLRVFKTNLGKVKELHLLETFSKNLKSFLVDKEVDVKQGVNNRLHREVKI
jgi:hypothetical protein